jgi:hypothetical protein
MRLANLWTNSANQRSWYEQENGVGLGVVRGREGIRACARFPPSGAMRCAMQSATNTQRVSESVSERHATSPARIARLKSIPVGPSKRRKKRSSVVKRRTRRSHRRHGHSQQLLPAPTLASTTAHWCSESLIVVCGWGGGWAHVGRAL